MLGQLRDSEEDELAEAHRVVFEIDEWRALNEQAAKEEKGPAAAALQPGEPNLGFGRLQIAAIQLDITAV